MRSNDLIFQELMGVRERVVVELGCGEKKFLPDAIGIDVVPLSGVDIVHNLEEGLHFIPDNAVDHVYSSHVLEHVENFVELMRELHRIVKPGGVIETIVPHFSNPHYYSDFTHKRFFGLYTFEYFVPGARQQLNRKVHDFYTDFHFVVQRRELRFKVYFSPRNLLNRFVVAPLFNRSTYWQEFYEDKFAYTFPCKELYVLMSPLKS